MIFNSKNYPTIKTACQGKQEIEFIAERSDTCFASSQAPSVWTAYPPTMLPPSGYAQVFLYAGSDAKGALTFLELLVHLDGGIILYKENGSDHVSLKVSWPQNSS